MRSEPDDTPIKDAATVVVIRDRAHRPRVLMGQRSAGAAFMPGKFVFPGGAVDTDDAAAPPVREIGAPCDARLTQDAAAGVATALCCAAIRELCEETGQILGRPGPWPTPVPQGWVPFANRGMRPDAAPLQFVYRAITPPGRPRRFDARFFLLDAKDLSSDPDDFSGASDELSGLCWVDLERAARLDIPRVTGLVLAAVAARISDPTPPPFVPFFDGRAETERTA